MVRERLPPETFNLPVEKIKTGYYTDVYFNRTREIMMKDDHNPIVTMQIFNKRAGIVCGIDEAIGILKPCSCGPDRFEIRALYDAVDGKLRQLAEQAGDETDQQRAQRLGPNVRKARSILDSVSSDGSWGVHNFKYTEAMLLEADKALSE